MKKAICLLVAVLFVISGCSSNETKKETNEATTNKVSKNESKGKCNVFECIEKIELTSSLDDVNNIIGIEGEMSKVEGNDGRLYEWELDNDSVLSIHFEEGMNTIISMEIEFSPKTITKRTDFSNWDTIKQKFTNKETLTYDEVVKLLNNVEGVLTKKTSASYTYHWYNSNNGYLFVFVDPETNICSSASGYF